MDSLDILIQSKGIQLSNEQLKRLLNGCIVNERTAQKELYSKYFGYAMSVALRYGNSYDDAVEITNNSFLSVYKSLKFISPKSDYTVVLFTGWIRRAVVNTSVEYIRKYMNSEQYMNGNIWQLIIADSQETVGQMGQHKDIINYIQQLPMAYRAVFNLYVIEGFSHAEIAVKLDISEGVSESNLRKARRTIKQLLSKSDLISYAQVV